jgi:hypothetical protein
LGTRARGRLRKTAVETHHPACRTGRRGETSTSKLAVLVASQYPPKTVCTTGGPNRPLASQPISQSGPNAWISEIWDYLKENILPEDHASAECIVRLAKRYAVVEGDLYRHGANDIHMRCITQEEGHELLTEIHGGECGSHSSSRTLVGKAFRHGFYWPTTLQDAAEMVKSCKACQFHAKQIHTPAQALQMIPPSWSFAIWGVDILGPFPRAVGGYRYLFVAIDKFTKWPEPPPWSTSPKVPLSPSSSPSSVDLGSQTVSLRTTEPSLQVGSSRNTAWALAPTLLCIRGRPQKQWPGREGKCRDPQGTQNTYLRPLEEAWGELGQ